MTGIFFRVEFNLPKTASGRFKIHKMEAEMCAFTASSFLRILISNAHRTETEQPRGNLKAHVNSKTRASISRLRPTCAGEKISSRHST